MQFTLVDRLAGAFQQPVSAEQVEAICVRVFGAGTGVMSAVELGGGMYNTTFRVQVVGQERPVILRVAPEPGRQFRSEHELMRNEYASVPWLTPLAAVMPKVIAADWSHEVIGRDYLVQSMLSGVPAPERLGDYPRSAWPRFFQQLGVLAGLVHAVHGHSFGPVAGPGFPTWSAAVTASLHDIAADLEGAGLDAADVREAVAGAAGPYRAVLDEVREPRLLAGDLWTVNVMLDGSAAQPTITGVFDLDRTWWGDPAADWTIRMAAAKPGSERDAFWDSYGARDRSPGAVLRAHLYEVRHLGAIRLERHRLGKAEAEVLATYVEIAAELTALTQAAGVTAR